MVRCFFSHLKTKQKKNHDEKSIRQSPTSSDFRSAPNTLSKFREDCPAFAGKTPFQDRVLRALNLPSLNLPSKIVEESDEKENDTRSVLFAVSPPKPTKRKSEEDSVVILSLQSRINNIINDLKEEKERSRKLEEECVETLKDELKSSQRDIASLKAELDSVQKKLAQTLAEWEREKSKYENNTASCCVVQ